MLMLILMIMMLMTSGSIERFDQRSLLLTALIEHDADDHDHYADADAYDADSDDLWLGEFNQAV